MTDHMVKRHQFGISLIMEEHGECLHLYFILFINLRCKPTVLNETFNEEYKNRIILRYFTDSKRLLRVHAPLYIRAPKAPQLLAEWAKPEGEGKQTHHPPQRAPSALSYTKLLRFCGFFYVSVNCNCP